MKRLCMYAFAALLAGCSTVHDETAEVRQPRVPANPSAQAQFERLKGLVGEWEVEDTQGELPPGTISYRLTAGGSTLVENLFVGSDHEMLSVYHLDGEDLVMQHFCVMQNAPKMRARAGGDPDAIDFECEGGTNIESCEDPHIHGSRFELVGPNEVRTACTMIQKDQPNAEKVFTLRRK